MPLLDVYYRAGDTAKANDFLKAMARVFSENLAFYNQVDPKFANFYKEDNDEAMMVLARLYSIAQQNKQQDLIKEMEKSFYIPQEIMQMFNQQP